jgi:hypothetical protein
MSTEESNKEEVDSFTSNGWRGREVRPGRRRCNGERDLQKLTRTINRKREIWSTAVGERWQVGRRRTRRWNGSLELYETDQDWDSVLGVLLVSAFDRAAGCVREAISLIPVPLHVTRYFSEHVLGFPLPSQPLSAHLSPFPFHSTDYRLV